MFYWPRFIERTTGGGRGRGRGRKEQKRGTDSEGKCVTCTRGWPGLRSAAAVSLRRAGAFRANAGENFPGKQ